MNLDKQSEGMPPHPSMPGPPPPMYPGSTAPPMYPGPTVPPVLPGSTVIVSTPVGANPSQQTCPSCGAFIVTRVEKKPTMKTHLIAILLCFTCLWPCACCVYCADSCRSTYHTCPNCDAYIGTYKN